MNKILNTINAFYTSVCICVNKVLNTPPPSPCSQELDVKAGGGCVMTIGEMVRSFLTKLEWFSTLFPRIPVPVQKLIDTQMKARPRKVPEKVEEPEEPPAEGRRRSR